MTGDVRDEGQELEIKATAICEAVENYISDVTPLVQRLERLRNAAQNVLACKPGEDPEENKDDEIEAILADVNRAIALFQRVEVTAYNAIVSQIGGSVRLSEANENGSWLTSPTASPDDPKLHTYGVSLEDLNRASLPWGAANQPDEESRGFLHGFIVDGFIGTVDGLATLTGINPILGRHGWAETGEAWKFLGSATVGAITYIPPFGFLPDSHVAPIGVQGRSDFRALGKEFIAYDYWGEGDRTQGGGILTFNLLTLSAGPLARVKAKWEASAAPGPAGGAAALNAISLVGKYADPMTYIGGAIGVATNVSGNLARLKHLNGTTMLPDGSVRLHEGTTHHVDGRIEFVDGTTITANNTVMFPEDSGIRSLAMDGTAIMSDGTVLKVDPSFSQAEKPMGSWAPDDVRRQYPTMTVTQAELVAQRLGDLSGYVPWGQISAGSMADSDIAGAP